MEWNYYDTFIEAAADCPAERGTVPPGKKSGRTKPEIEFDLLFDRPYEFTQEDVLFETHVRHKGFPAEELAARREELRAAFFGKPQACMRASMLPKKYGWGLHFNAEGKVALVAKESPEYDAYASGARDGVRVLKAMRNSRAK
ncbi:DUF6157 family protein [Cohnella suwonensis]|uniref:DUF6157 family protein n=1 Tax=Cohnella suwonensis TaxID=696072 RepID=A0ABW0LS83_9BACL